MDGWITIGTEINNNKFDKQILDLEKKMKKEEDKKIEKEVKILNLEKEINAYDEAEKKVIEYTKTLENLKAEKENIMKQGNYSFATPQGTVGFSNEYKDVNREIQKINADLIKQTQIINSQNGSIDSNRAKLEKVKSEHQQISDKVSEYKSKIEGIKLQKQVAEVEKLKNGFKGVGSSLQDAVRQAGRLVFGVFAIRSAYMALRQASSYLGTYDKQYSANLEYIKYSLTQVIAPVLRYIVSLAATLLSYINAIVQGWFGINLFSNASAKSFKDMKTATGGIGKATSGVAKAVKEIKKQLAGFDEMNILSNNENKDSSSSGGGGGAGVTMPNFDLSAMQAEVPKWLQWIIDNKDLVIAGLMGIAAALVALKLGASGLMALGIGIAVAGIIYAVESLLNYLKDPSWENFGKIIQGIGIAIIGFGVIIGSIPLVIAGVIVIIVGLVIQHWEKIKSFLQNGIDWLKGKSDWVHQMFGDTIGSIYDTFVDILQSALNWLDDVFSAIKGILDGIINVVKGVFTGNWKLAWEGIKQIVANIIKIIFSTVVNTFNSILAVLKAIVNSIVNIFKTAVNMILSLFKKLGGKAGETVSNAFKSVINSVLGAVERILNAPINSMNALIDRVNSIPGVNFTSRLTTFSLPRLKSGGIINMPNRGTLVGSAIAGESGREGVIPLTDEQAMAELGREIGKNVLVNLTNVTTMNGRVISREIKKVGNKQDFAYNT